MPCDLCSDPTTKAVIKPADMSRAVQSGFNPFHLGLIPPSLLRLATPDYPRKWEQQAIDWIMSHSDWTLCEGCMPKLRPFLTTSARHPVPGP